MAGNKQLGDLIRDVSGRNVSTAEKYVCLSKVQRRLTGLRSYDRQGTSVGTYVALVLEQSQDEGDEFDLGYALRIACETINVETHDKILMKSNVDERTAEMSDTDFDYWLSGFNSEQ